MKFTKKISAALMMLFVAATANAQDIKINIDPVTVAVGEEAEIVMNYETDTPAMSCQFEVILPEGLSFVKQVVEEGEDPVLAVKGTALTSKHDIMPSKPKDEQGKHYAFVIGGLTDKTLKTSGSLMSFKVVADEALAETAEISVSKIIFADAEKFYEVNDVVVPVTKGTPTGISNVETSVENAASFNLGGVKFGKSGIRVQKGKKFVQK